MKKYLIIISVLSVCLIAVACGFAYSSFSLTEQRENNNVLSKNLTSAKSEINEMKNEVDEKEKSISELESQIKKLEKEIKENDSNEVAYNEETDDSLQVAAQNETPDNNFSSDSVASDSADNTEKTTPSTEEQAVVDTPKNVEYTGEPFADFAAKYGMTVEELAQMNNFSDPSQMILMKGQTVTVK